VIAESWNQIFIIDDVYISLLNCCWKYQYSFDFVPCFVHFGKWFMYLHVIWYFGWSSYTEEHIIKYVLHYNGGRDIKYFHGCQWDPESRNCLPCRFYWWRKLEYLGKTIGCLLQIIDKLYHIRLYRVPLTLSENRTHNWSIQYTH